MHGLMIAIKQYLTINCLEISAIRLVAMKKMCVGIMKFFSTSNQKHFVIDSFNTKALNSTLFAVMLFK